MELLNYYSNGTKKIKDIEIRNMEDFGNYCIEAFNKEHKNGMRLERVEMQPPAVICEPFTNGVKVYDSAEKVSNAEIKTFQLYYDIRINYTEIFFHENTFMKSSRGFIQTHYHPNAEKVKF